MGLKTTCQQCKGNGYHEEKLLNHGTKEWEWQTVLCMNPGCENGIVDHDKQYEILWGKRETVN